MLRAAQGHRRDMDLEWFSAEAIMATLLGKRYAFDAGRLAAALGTEGRELHTLTDVSVDRGYFPLDAATLSVFNAILHVAFSAPGRHSHLA